MVTEILRFENRITVITGHYGCGKTNLAVNLALELNKEGKRTALCDLDIVNPYFRSADFSKELEQLGIEMILPPFANSNVDVPTLTARVSAAINDPSIHLILDVGGDDAGAAALGRYSADIKKQGYDMLYLVNAYRFLTQTAEEAIENMREIEYASRLSVTALLNSSNLAGETTAETVNSSMEFAKKAAALADLPLFAAAERSVADAVEFDRDKLFVIDRKVKTVWEK